MAYSLEISYNAGDDTMTGAYGAGWRAQTFTTGASFDLTRVSLKLYRTGNPGDCVMGVYDTLYSKPSGAALAFATLDGDTFSTDSGGVWYNFDLTSPLTLDTTTMYAVVITAISGDVSNTANWRRDGTAPTYAGGASCTSTNSGSSWTIGASDMMFELYSGLGVEYVDVAGTAAMTMGATGDLEVPTFIDIAGTAAMTMGATGELAVNILNTTHNVCLVAAGNDEIWYEDI